MKVAAGEEPAVSRQRLAEESGRKRDPGSSTADLEDSVRGNGGHVDADVVLVKPVEAVTVATATVPETPSASSSGPAEAAAAVSMLDESEVLAGIALAVAGRAEWCGCL